MRAWAAIALVFAQVEEAPPGEAPPGDEEESSCGLKHFQVRV